MSKKELIISGRFKIAIDREELLHEPDSFDRVREMLIDALKKTYFLKAFREAEGLSSPYPQDATITELSQKIIVVKARKTQQT